MCAPHAASLRVDMLAHAELAWRLLPGNSFVISNYIHALLREGRPEGQEERVLELAREIIGLAPKSPEGYLQAIYIHTAASGACGGGAGVCGAAAGAV
jgi:hypothetical protein